jgi:hypothetical protein
VLIPCEPLPLFLPLSRIYGLDHSEINTSFYRGSTEGGNSRTLIFRRCTQNEIPD